MNVIHTIAARHLSALALALTLVAAALPACSDGGGSSPPVATGGEEPPSSEQAGTAAATRANAKARAVARTNGTRMM